MDQAIQRVLFMLIQEQQEFRKKQEQVMSTLAKALGHLASLRSCHKQGILVDECVELSEMCGVQEESQDQGEDVKSQHEVQEEINEEWIGIDEEDSIIQDFFAALGHASLSGEQPPAAASPCAAATLSALPSLAFILFSLHQRRMGRKGKEKANPLAHPPPVSPSDHPDTFVNFEAQEQYKKLEKRAFHYERKLNLPEKYADIILDIINIYHWGFIKSDPVEVNEHQVKEFYANLLNRDAQTIFLRGVTLDTSNTTLEALLDIPHIPSARDAYTQIMTDVTTGKISLDEVLKKIGQPEATWEYKKREQPVPSSIACTDFNPEARIWQYIIADYILSSTHATHIRIRVAVLLWSILEGKRISVLPLIRESMMKPYLPYGDYDGPPQRKRKTIEPPSAVAEPSAPPSAPAPIPQPQTPYEMCREILQAVHHYERRNARRFQWIVAKFEGRDPGPPPPDTLEPEAEEPASEEPAAEAGQVV
ncbi:hypothetical protein Ahy_B08g090476 [Arachis hypogaea]|uniref:Putative plant transposon protein domain-containing protein n=1 Tax=Arachis hypogaea TaxID=3818 RepID=A0A444Y072_ARAHY|nr:hypothetical protein Ahy_B08g090476 [Arachis hypogaea]